MTCSYMEGKVPKLIVRDIFQNIPRFYCDIKIMISVTIWSMDLLCRMRIPHPLDQPSRARVNQQTSFKMNLGIFRHITKCRSSEKSEIFLERQQHIERRIFFRNICHLSSWNSTEIYEGEEETLKLFRQCTYTRRSLDAFWSSWAAAGEVSWHL